MSLTSDLIIECNKQARASLGNVYLACACEIDSFTASLTDHSFTGVATAVGFAGWAKYEFEPQKKSIEGEGVNEDGTPTFTYKVMGKLKAPDKDSMFVLQELLNQRRVTAIVETANKRTTDKIAFTFGWDNIQEGDAAGVPNVTEWKIEEELDGDYSAMVEITAKHAELTREFVGSITLLDSSTVDFGG